MDNRKLTPEPRFEIRENSMPNVQVIAHTDRVDIDAICALANRSQPYYVFDNGEGTTRHAVRITEKRDESLFRLLGRYNMAVSIWQLDGISRYAKIGETELLLVAILFGLVQQRCLNNHELIKLPDLLHQDPEACLFTKYSVKSDYAFKLENPYICEGCLDFYACLGLKREIVSLKEVATYIRSNRKCETHGVSFATRQQEPTFFSDRGWSKNDGDKQTGLSFL